MRGKKKNLPCRKRPNNICLYFVLNQRGGTSLPILKYGLCVVTSFQRAQNGKLEKSDFVVSKRDKPYLRQIGDHQQ